MEKFQSDFRPVAEFFVQSRKLKEGLIKEYQLPDQEVVHVREFIELFVALAGEDLMEVIPAHVVEGGKPVMIKTLWSYGREEWEKVGWSKGVKDGRTEGESITMANDTHSLMGKLGLPEQEAMDLLDIPDEKREKVSELIMEISPGKV